MYSEARNVPVALVNAGWLKVVPLPYVIGIVAFITSCASADAMIGTRTNNDATIAMPSNV